MNRTVSGCAITVLVEGLTEFAAASYATETALLAELRATWPPLPKAVGTRRANRDA
jgi:hypothetical protein